jgi:hypothetical protein
MLNSLDTHFFIVLFNHLKTLKALKTQEMILR